MVSLLEVSTAGKPIYYVSAKRDVFTPMKLPKYTLPKVTSVQPNWNEGNIKILINEIEFILGGSPGLIMGQQ